MATGVKSLLAVSWAMPPMLYPRAIQVSRTLHELSRRGWVSTALCLDAATSPKPVACDPSLAELYGSGYEAVRVPDGLEAGARADVLRSHWQSPALVALRQVAQTRQFTVLVTFAQPWGDHLIGLKAQRILGLPWVAHFSDPWVDNPYNAHRGDKTLNEWRKLERRVVRRADALVFTNAVTLDLVMAKYPAAWRSKAHVVPHGYDAELKARCCPDAQPGGPLRMVHVGDLYGSRGPGGLVDGLLRLSQKMVLKGRLEVALIGRCASDHRGVATGAGLEGVLAVRSQQPYLESLGAAGAADVLLLIDAPSRAPSPFLPSKLVDYLMFRKPILGLTPTEGVAADLLRRIECPVVPPDDGRAIAEAIKTFMDRRESGALPVAPAFDAVARDYDVRVTTDGWEEILHKVTAPGPRRTLRSLFRHRSP